MEYCSKRCAAMPAAGVYEISGDDNGIVINSACAPIVPPQSVMRAAAEAGVTAYTRYPDSDCIALSYALAEKHGVSPERIVVGSGAEELFALAFNALADEDGAGVAHPSVYNEKFRALSRYVRVKQKDIPCDNFRFDAETAAEVDAQVIIIPTPGTYSGNVTGIKDLAKIAAARYDRVVIADESTAMYDTPTSSALVLNYDNFAVIRSFSSLYGMPGIRCAYMIASSGVAECVRKMKRCFCAHSVSAITCNIALAALAEDEYYEAAAAEKRALREDFADGMRKAGFEVFPSQAGYVLVSGSQTEASEIYFALKERGVYVRAFKRPGMENYLRFAIGTAQEMNTALKIIKTII